MAAFRTLFGSTSPHGSLSGAANTVVPDAGVLIATTSRRTAWATGNSPAQPTGSPLRVSLFSAISHRSAGPQDRS